MREISIAAKLGPNYLSEALKKNPDKRKDMTLSNFSALVQELGVSPLYIITGIRLDPFRERLLKIFSTWGDAEVEEALKTFERFSSLQPKPKRRAGALRVSAPKRRKG